MKKNNLTNGDIVVTRRGELAVVILNDRDAYLLYQTSGWESLDDFDDDMVYQYDLDESNPDAVMQVYRGDCALGFTDFEDEAPVYERDDTWTRPSAEERATATKTRSQALLNSLTPTEAKPKNNNIISVIAQQFYGNRTGTAVNKDYIDYLIRGDLSNDHDPREIKDLVRKVVRVPGSDHIVIVYDQTQEDQYVNIEFPETYARIGADYLKNTGRELKMHISCEIPEIGFKIHTRCIACRMDKDGVFQSLEASDEEKFIHFFTE